MILDIVIPLWLFLVQGELSISHSQALKMVEEANRNYAPYGIRLELKELQVISDLYPELNDVNQQTSRLLKYARWAKKTGYVKPRRVVHFLFPRFPTGHIAGMAVRNGWKKRRAVSMSNATEFNPFGAPRFKHSIEAMRHEILHSLCLSHFDGNVNLMSTAPLPWVERLYPLMLNPVSISLIKQCMKKPRRGA